MYNAKNERRRASFNEIIIIVALVFSPFTSLRFSFFGITEILFIILFAWNFYRQSGMPYFMILTNSIGKYYAFFLIITIIGWGYNIVSGINSGILSSAIFNLAAYTITSGTILCVESLLQDRITGIRAGYILEKFFLYFGLISTILYLISLRTPNLFGYHLKYYTHFCPLANNLHQYAMVALPLSFIGLFYLAHEKLRIKQIFYFLLSIGLAFFAYSTGSDKAVMGLVVGAVVFLVMCIINGMADDYQRLVFVAFWSVFAVMLILIFHKYIIELAIQLFTEADSGGSRQYLYTGAIKKIISLSPIVGLGPSVHVSIASGELYDAHETFLAAGLSGGIIGLLCIVAFMVSTLKRVWRNSFFIAAIMPIMIYALGGDLLRKTAIWVILLFVSYNTTGESSSGIIAEKNMHNNRKPDARVEWR